MHESRLTKVCSVISRFSASLAPYFDIITIFVSSHPECAALVWGSLRLIFALSSNFVTYLEKVAELLDKLASSLPAYGQYVDLLRERYDKTGRDHSRFASALGVLYADLLVFCHHVCLTLSRKRMGKPPSVMFLPAARSSLADDK